MKIVALAGGTGAAKFLRGLCRVVPAADVTIIGNTGDDLEMWGVHVSPDLDTVMYTLADVVDKAKGWGLAGDTFQCRDAMGRLGQTTFFGLGDRDLATHLARTEALRGGKALHEVTDDLRRKLGVESRILPMSNEPVRTRVRTPAGWLAFQEFFVRDRCAPEVLDLDYHGADQARPAPGVVEAIRDAHAVLICPSNPISSVGPILAVPGMRAALAETRGKVAAVSPIIGTAPVSGPAGKMMQAKGFEVSPFGVADVYRGFIDVIVLDQQDGALAPRFEERDLRALVTGTIMDSPNQEMALARAVIEALS